MTQKILVTGSAGFIGFHLCKLLLSEGCVVHGFDAMTEYYDVRLKRADAEQGRSSSIRWRTRRPPTADLHPHV